MASLYEISYINKVYYYTSAQVDKAYTVDTNGVILGDSEGSRTYEAKPIYRNEIQHDFFEQDLTISISNTIEPIVTLKNHVAETRIKVRVLDLDGVVIYDGEVKEVRNYVDRNHSEIYCTAHSSLRLSSLPSRPYQRSCPFSLYEGFTSTVIIGKVSITSGTASLSGSSTGENKTYFTSQLSVGDIINLDRLEQLEILTITNDYTATLTTNATITHTNAPLFKEPANTRCPVNKFTYELSEFVSNWAIKAGTNGLTIERSPSPGFTTDVYKNGFIVFVDSLGNERRVVYIRANTVNEIDLFYPLVDLVGLTIIKIYKGCNKIRTGSSNHCYSKFNVGPDFGGFPGIPNPSDERGLFGIGTTKTEVTDARDLTAMPNWLEEPDYYITETRVPFGTVTLPSTDGGRFVPIIYGRNIVQGKMIWNGKVSTPKISWKTQFDSTWSGAKKGVFFFYSYALAIAERVTELNNIRFILGDKSGHTFTVNTSDTADPLVVSMEVPLQDYAKVSEGQRLNPGWANPGNSYRVKFTSIDSVPADAEGIFGKTHCRFYWGNQETHDHYLKRLEDGGFVKNGGNAIAANEKFGDIKYKGVSYLVLGENEVAKILYDTSYVPSYAGLESHSNGTSGAFWGSVKADVPDANINDLIELPDKILFDVSNIPSLGHYELTTTQQGEKNLIGTDLANPITVIYDIIVNQTKYSQEDIDGESFRAARDTVYTDGLGLAFVIKDTIPVSKVIEKLLEFCEARLVRKYNSTSKKFTWHIIVMRESDSVTQSFSETNTNNTRVTYGDWSKVTTDLEVEYIDVSTKEDNTVTLANEGARLQVGGVVRRRYGYKYRTTESIALKVASIKAAKLMRPLSTIKLDYASSLGELYPGDVIDYTFVSAGISNTRNYRVLSISGYNERDSKRSISAIEIWNDFDFIPALQPRAGHRYKLDIDATLLKSWVAGWQEFDYPTRGLVPIFDAVEDDSSDIVPDAVYRVNPFNSNLSVSNDIEPMDNYEIQVNSADFSVNNNLVYDPDGFIKMVKDGNEHVLGSQLTSGSSETYTDDDVYSLKYIGIIYINGLSNNEIYESEMFAFDEFENVDGTYFKLKGIYRNIFGVSGTLGAITKKREDLTVCSKDWSSEANSLYVTIFRIPTNIASIRFGHLEKFNSNGVATSELRANFSYYGKIFHRKTNKSHNTIKWDADNGERPEIPYPISDLHKHKPDSAYNKYFRFAPTLPGFEAVYTTIASDVKPSGNIDYGMLIWKLEDSSGTEIAHITQDTGVYQGVLPSGYSSLTVSKNTLTTDNYYGYIELKIEMTADETHLRVYTFNQGNYSEYREVDF